MKWCVSDLAGVSSKLSAAEVEQHLEQGKRLLASGQLSDALSHYHAAVGEWFLFWTGVCLISTLTLVVKFYRKKNLCSKLSVCLILC